MGGARIGERCNLGQNVFVADGVVVGDDVKIQNNVSLYTGVTLGDGVFVGPSAVFTNVSTPRARVSRRDRYLATPVGAGATIGANATVVCGHRIGAHAFVAAGAVVTRDVGDHVLVMGTPARPRGFVCACGERLPANLRCSACGAPYAEAGDGLRPLGGEPSP